MQTHFAIVAMLAILTGCTNRGERTTAGAAWCEQLHAQCPGDWDEGRGSCEEFCGTGRPGAGAHEDCEFGYCAVQTGYCDNEEPGDPTILACIDSL